MIYLGLLKMFLLITWIQTTTCVSIRNPLLKDDSPDDFAVHYLSSKGYIPNENKLSKIVLPKANTANDATLILSKLTDEELIRLLNDHPKREEYIGDDVINYATENKKIVKDIKPNKIRDSNKREPQVPVFKLNHKEVDQFAVNAEGDPKYNAYQTINNILYSHPSETDSEENEENKEMIFDVLVTQLKALCCKKSKQKKTANKLKLLMESFLKNKHYEQTQAVKNRATENNLGFTKEYIFLVVNDEIKSSNVSDDELVQVDPDSLSKNSSVLLLGPMKTPLNEKELSLVIKRIANELSQPEYLPLLEKLSRGSFEDNLGLKNSLITGPQTRRYIKPHRCNHQSLITRIHGGPKWLICSGYLNLNTPSLYD